jgi:hypothetical protein
MCELKCSHAEVGENALFVFDNNVKLTYILISHQSETKTENIFRVLTSSPVGSFGNTSLDRIPKNLESLATVLLINLPSRFHTHARPCYPCCFPKVDI